MFRKLFKHKGVQAPLTLSVVFLDECRVREEIKVTDRKLGISGRLCHRKRLSEQEVFCFRYWPCVWSKKKSEEEPGRDWWADKIDPSCLGLRCWTEFWICFILNERGFLMGLHHPSRGQRIHILSILPFCPVIAYSKHQLKTWSKRKDRIPS